MPTPNPPWRARALAIATMIALSAIGAWTFTHMNVSTEMSHFLPASEDQELAELARETTSSDLSRSITILVSASDEAQTVAAAQALAARLEARDEVEWIRSGPGEDMNEAFYELYFERRLAFFSDRPDELGEGGLSDEAPAEAQRIFRIPTGS